ncbi:unnamed protein product [Didymodactylos carnosus]|uniref:Microtubule-associated protein 1A/B/S-like MBL-like domain-containing protein n=1 Tax=Didymodactylos carnosus TaxID=1234261 RepID=A0A813R646_9BILA|nr:unnamed protein product [Didymodactylos carnosus]CAF0816621.1 unnamed protein product [Didymodactylos carnosus]CAF3559903.1 unnamed protein product [Didymodactylos carnosus]CAF3600722.1 unnamed protein product [Didymodactylos carnosus]
MAASPDVVKKPETVGFLLSIGEIISNDQKDEIVAHVKQGLNLVDEKYLPVKKLFDNLIDDPQNEFKADSQYRQITSNDSGIAGFLYLPSYQTFCNVLKDLFSHCQNVCIIYSGQQLDTNGSFVLSDSLFSCENFQSLEEVNGWSVNELQLMMPYVSQQWAKFSTNYLQKHIQTVSIEELSSKTKDSTGDFGENFYSKFSSIYTQIDLDLYSKMVPSTSSGTLALDEPNLYVLYGQQGEASLFGIRGFVVLINGGYSRYPSYWNLIRGIQSIDACVLTHFDHDVLSGLQSILHRKTIVSPEQKSINPDIGAIFLNQHQKTKLFSQQNKSSVGNNNKLQVNLNQNIDQFLSDIKRLQIETFDLCKPSTKGQLEPINLYRKIAFGSLDLYPLHPTAQSDVEITALQKILINDHPPSSHIPSHHWLSSCFLLVWSPSKSSKQDYVRILYTGASPQTVVFEALQKVKYFEFLHEPTYRNKSGVTPQVPKAQKAKQAPPPPQGAATSNAATSSTTTSNTQKEAKNDQTTVRPKSQQPSSTASPGKSTTNAGGQKSKHAPQPPSTATKEKPKSAPLTKQHSVTGKSTAPPATPRTTIISKKPKAAPSKGASNEASKSEKESSSKGSQGDEDGEEKTSEHERAEEEGEDHVQHENGHLLTHLASSVADTASTVVEKASDVVEKITNAFTTNNDEKTEDDVQERANHVEERALDIKEDAEENVEEHEQETSGHHEGYTYDERQERKSMKLDQHNDQEDKIDSLADPDLMVPSKDFGRNDEKNEQTLNESIMKRPESVGFMPQPASQTNTEVNDTFVVSGPTTPLDETQTRQPQDVMTTSYIDGNNVRNPFEENNHKDDIEIIHHDLSQNASVAMTTEDVSKIKPLGLPKPTNEPSQATTTTTTTSSKKAPVTTKKPAGTNGHTANGGSSAAALNTTMARPSNGSINTATNQQQQQRKQSKSFSPSAPIFYVDVAYIPHHGNENYVDSEFFRRVRARYYVLNAVQISRQTLDALVEGKQQWDKKDLQVTIVPTFDGEQLRLFFVTNKSRLQELNINIMPASTRCNVQYDENNGCPAVRLRFQDQQQEH